MPVSRVPKAALSSEQRDQPQQQDEDAYLQQVAYFVGIYLSFCRK
jgi:hypothetical protein